MARRSGLGKGLSALIPSEVDGGDGLAAPGGARSRTSGRTPSSPGATSTRSPWRRWPPPSRRSACSSRSWSASSTTRTESYELIAGERRWRAARRAGLQTIPVLVQVADDVASLEQALVENLHRVDLNALEEAAAYQQLIDEFGLTHEQVATRMGKGRATVTNTLRLLQLPAGAQRALAERTISAGHARALLGTPDRALQEKLVERIVEEGLTVRAVEELVPQRRRRAPGRPRRAPDAGRAGARRSRYDLRSDRDGAAPAAAAQAPRARRARARGAPLDLPEHPGQGRHPEPAGPPGGRVRHPRGPRAHLPRHGR